MRKIITLLSCLVCLQLSAQITTYNINRSIKCTDTIQPFATNANSYGISIDGEGLLLSDTAFIRVVLVDNNDDEWLVYERNSLFATEEGNLSHLSHPRDSGTLGTAWDNFLQR